MPGLTGAPAHAKPPPPPLPTLQGIILPPVPVLNKPVVVISGSIGEPAAVGPPATPTLPLRELPAPLEALPPLVVPQVAPALLVTTGCLIMAVGAWPMEPPAQPLPPPQLQPPPRVALRLPPQKAPPLHLPVPKLLPHPPNQLPPLLLKRPLTLNPH